MLTSLTVFAFGQSFLHNTPYRDSLPSAAEFWRHPIRSGRQAVHVYQLTVLHDSEKVNEKRQRLQEDVKKREEFKRAHGVDPGFVRHGWLSKFGTVEQDERRAKQEEEQELEAQQMALADFNADAVGHAGREEQPGSTGDSVQEPERKRKRPVKKWLGIW